MSFDAASVLPSLLAQLDEKGTGVTKPTPEQIADVEQRLACAVIVYLKHWELNPKLAGGHLQMTLAQDHGAACAVVLHRHNMVMTGLESRDKRSMTVHFKRCSVV